ncbi:AraC family transcriptional regulator [Ruminiclostridium cellobioparum]|uniref:AraC family transcriptional regulator n=1 Tax=Ruminiclostridium cellobioparum TaxID=29355 RepID=UPI0028AA2636|nr:AraC family transcriptional regulator [Ruminiclostridium cellobioparum]
MNTNNLFFNILYCNGSRSDAYMTYPRRISKAMKHHKLVLVTGGKGKIVIGEKKYYLKKGTLIYYSASSGDIEIDVEEPITFLSVVFDYVNVVLCDGIYSIAGDTAIITFQPVQQLINLYQVEAAFEKLVLTWKAKGPGYEFISKTLLQELFITIFQNRYNHSSNYSDSLKVEKIIQYMCENIHRKIQLAELSELVQISIFHLSKIFREKTGYSVIEYFNKIKIDQAKVLLIEGDKKVKEIAYLLGFSDEFYFSRIFKKVEGISPSEYHNKNVHEI